MSWEKYESAAERRPIPFAIKIIIFFVVISAILGTVGYAFNWFGEAAQVAREEFGPRGALHKYEWFIEQASAIEKMDKDVEIFKGRLVGVKDQYQGYGEDMSKWPPHIQSQYNSNIGTARNDLVAIVSQRNNLVKEYNAASEKFNWAPFKTKVDKPRERFQEYAVVGNSIQEQ